MKLLSAARTSFIAAVLLALAGALQSAGHAYSSNFGAEEADEPAHYVTGLMMRDYVANGFPSSPLTFAKNYYLHYPKVALGVWPPFFYVVEGIWMLVFSPSRGSVLILSAAISVACAMTLFLVIRRWFGAALGILAGSAYLLLPAVQISTSSVMVDGLVTLLELLAAIQFALYADSELPKHAYAFGFLSALCALTKANALALLLVPGIVLALTRSWRLLRRKEVWLAGLIVLAAAAPWNYFLLRLAIDSVSLIRADAGSMANRASAYLHIIAGVSGVFLPLAAVGIWMMVVRPLKKGRVSGLWASAFALMLAGFLFHTVLPVKNVEPRYVLPFVAPALLFAAAGLHWIAQAIPVQSRTPEWKTAAVAAFAALVFFVFQFRIAQRDQPGFTATARRLAQEPRPRAILVCANAQEEGMAVSEIALADARPGHYILRSSKVLSQSDWNGQGYHSRFDTARQVSEYLESVPVDYVLFTTVTSYGRLLHGRLLLEALRSHPERWRPDPAARGPFSLWARVHPLAHGEPNFSVDMKYTFNSSLSTAADH